MISEVVDLNLNAIIATTIPQDGRIEFIFPKEVKQLPYQTAEGCVLVSAVYFHRFKASQAFESN